MAELDWEAVRLALLRAKRAGGKIASSDRKLVARAITADVNRYRALRVSVRDRQQPEEEWGAWTM